MTAHKPDGAQPGEDVAVDAADAFGRAFTDGDVDGFVAFLTDDVYFEAPSVMQQTVVKLTGRDDVRRYLQQTAGAYSDLHVTTNVIRSLGSGRFLVLGRWRAIPCDTTTPFATPFGSVLDVREGKVARVRNFFDEQQAIEAAELA